MRPGNQHMQQDALNEYLYSVNLYTAKMSKALEFKSWSILLAISTAIVTVGIEAIKASFLMAQELLIFQEILLFVYLLCIIYFDGKYNEYNYKVKKCIIASLSSYFLSDNTYTYEQLAKEISKRTCVGENDILTILTEIYPTKDRQMVSESSTSN
ncbi:MAG: hypothetical protein CVT88_07950 [Candidatus Altiarchaeales archaeon HGW-Altiarchaeales-1]|nr:MAG: hypothetical protein CVT88_07950 [Candidatus Altiarchaeales archaeon HGW-Altiarchaeales-1]